MKLRTPWIALACVIGTAALAAPKGTNVLHLSLEAEFAPGTDSDAVGSLSLKLRQQGNADVQSLRMELGGLDPTLTYSLYAVHDPLAPDGMEVTEFQPDGDGTASFKLKHLGHSNDPAKHFGDALDPLSEVFALQVRDEAGALPPVAEALLGDSASIRYLVKRRLDEAGDAEGTLFLKQHGSKALFRLRADGLDPDGAYVLAINCTDAAALVCDYSEDVVADADGRLDVRALSGATPPVPFDMTNLALVDVDPGPNAVVLSTELP